MRCGIVVGPGINKSLHPGMENPPVLKLMESLKFADKSAYSNKFVISLRY